MYIFDPVKMSHFQKTHNKLIKEPKFINVFCDKEVCAPIIPSQKNKNCRNYWKLKTAMTYMFFKVYVNF